jgi:hypothetical protein
VSPQNMGYDFELLVKKNLDDNGFMTQLISSKQFNYTSNKLEIFGDGGIDIIAKYRNSMEVHIQCKCLAKKAGPNIIREINGIKNQKIVCVVSKNGFTDPAIKEAGEYNIILAEEDNISEKLIGYYNNIYLKQKKKDIEFEIDFIENIKINNIYLSNIKKCTIKISQSE